MVLALTAAFDVLTDVTSKCHMEQIPTVKLMADCFVKLFFFQQTYFGRSSLTGAKSLHCSEFALSPFSL